jgi:putative acyl-CoA dehydrogenase
MMNEFLPSDTLDASPDGYSTHQIRNHPSRLPNSTPSPAMSSFAPRSIARCLGLRTAARRSAPVVGDEDVQELARLANRYVPELRTDDRFGNRADWVDFHPSWRGGGG